MFLPKINTPYIEEYSFLSNEKFDKRIFINHDRILQKNDLENIKKNNDIKILLSLEPNVVEPYAGLPDSWTRQNAKYFDFCLTSRESLIDDSSIKNTIWFPWSGLWTQKNTKEKEFKISFMCGSKNFAPGHKLRQILWNKRNSIKINKDLYTSGIQGGPPGLNNDAKVLDGGKYGKTKLFDGIQFHLCIENCSQKYYFTEKLIDCLYTYTVPVYWGCKNIGDYFDTRGFIILNESDSPEEMISKINNLNSSTYSNMKKYIERNHFLAQEYYNPFDVRLYNKIKNLIGIRQTPKNFLD